MRRELGIPVLVFSLICITLSSCGPVGVVPLLGALAGGGGGGGGADYDYPYSIQQTIDGGYIMAGDMYSFGAGRRGDNSKALPRVTPVGDTGERFFRCRVDNAWLAHVTNRCYLSAGIAESREKDKGGA